MKYYYKIPKEVAESIGKIKYTIDGRMCEIDPFCSEQKTGEFLITEETAKLINLYKEEKIDFDKFVKITEKEIDLKDNL